ncbi:MAG: hypothetical protein OEY89_06515 [Gammaproteobacteria bacterium]|nr:hypothetical protein [Gammaproteobacteria bacterium]
MSRYYLAALLCCLSLDVLAVDRLEMDAVSIKGNSELPKSLYIVPWQQAEQSALNGQLVNDLLESILTPLDREEFLRGLVSEKQ